MRTKSGLQWMAATVVAAALVHPAMTRAYYIEVRGANSEAGVDVPIRYADADSSSANTVEIQYRVNEESFPEGVANVGAAITAAFASWTDVDCANAVFTYAGPSTSTDRTHWMADAGDIYVLVFFSTDPTHWTSGPSVGNFYWAHDGTGRLIGGTVVLNAVDHVWATDGNLDRMDVQGIVTALIGRTLGITSNMEGNATFPRYGAGDTSKRDLGDDDRDAIRYLYPVEGSVCNDPVEPEEMCPTTPTPGAPPCPPEVTTNPGDGGTNPRVDAGPMVIPDAGPPDAGDVVEEPSNCTCNAGPKPSGLRLSPLALVGLGLLVARRRRRR